VIAILTLMLSLEEGGSAVPLPMQIKLISPCSSGQLIAVAIITAAQAKPTSVRSSVPIVGIRNRGTSVAPSLNHRQTRSRFADCGK
jgi:hypothetical protein